MSTVPYFLPDLTTEVASSLNNLLTTGTPMNPIDETPNAAKLPEFTNVWTYTENNGTVNNSGESCTSWTQNTGYGAVGSTPNPNGNYWTATEQIDSCSVALHLYCFQQ
jgi:hypothetical protein